ncbi:MAG: hypothetical protein IJC30_00020, partial [Alphaproteobacteria bacterium]|nr:hypothetical protein [Alphaproteobacteria bacterium]
MKYRLGLDMGATSIGWAVYNIENDTVEDMGIRIFDDGREDKTKKSLCVKRREVRGARRLQNRKRMQKAYLLKTLIQYGLFPKAKEEQQALKSSDVYGLRKKALDEKITLYEFGRVLFQLVQRRGFLSNRKDNREEGGKLKAGYAHLKEKMASENARTYGEYLYNQILRGESPRLKGIIDSDGKFKGDDFPFRELYIMEFETLFEKQQQYYSDVLTSDLKALLKDVLFFQRPLKEAEEGMCTFEYGEKRIAKAHPLFQEFRIWQHIMNLEFCSETESEYRRLSQKEIERLVFILQHPTDYIKTKKALLTYKEIKALLGLDKKGLFNYELKSSKEDDTKGVLADTTAFAVGQVECLRPVWENLSETDKEEIVKIISRPETYIKKPKKVSAEGYDALIIDCLCQRFSLSNEVGQALLYDVEWEAGFGALSEKALRKIVEAMKTGMTYDMACQEAGYHHSHKETVHRDFLPYYGEILEQSCIGQKDNPTTPEERYGKIA